MALSISNSYGADFTIQDWLDVNVNKAVTSAGCTVMVSDYENLDPHQTFNQTSCLTICNNTNGMINELSLSNMAKCGLWSSLPATWQYYFESQEYESQEFGHELQSLDHWQMNYTDAAYAATARRALSIILMSTYLEAREYSFEDHSGIPFACTDEGLFPWHPKDKGLYLFDLLPQSSGRPSPDNPTYAVRS